MAQDNKQLNKGSAHLERAKLKAAYNYKKRLREQEEEKRFKEALDSGNPFMFDDETETQIEADFADDTADKKGKK